MVVQHIAGLPVEEVLLAALAAAAPVIALAGLEIRSRIKRLKAWVRRRGNPPDPDASLEEDARLRGYEFGGAGSGQGVDG
ncbi:hypothetical protein [Kribbella kalugense]|uniref:Uncharacterized protein n=1 Tax=Kribbella kalugense TaxID=2512221 RepID=A0A4R7ZQ67_9ACTN|nr:hypothetical protein [Kribbella kalugense]TDW18718.1 hypothetical protein EV650_5314 [Kribbella kalugense]